MLMTIYNYVLYKCKIIFSVWSSALSFRGWFRHVVPFLFFYWKKKHFFKFKVEGYQPRMTCFSNTKCVIQVFYRMREIVFEKCTINYRPSCLAQVDVPQSQLWWGIYNTSTLSWFKCYLLLHVTTEIHQYSVQVSVNPHTTPYQVWVNPHTSSYRCQ